MAGKTWILMLFVLAMCGGCQFSRHPEPTGAADTSPHPPPRRYRPRPRQRRLPPCSRSRPFSRPVNLRFCPPRPSARSCPQAQD